MQYVIPLLLIFLAYGSVSNEKEAHRLKLLIFQGIPMTRLVFAKSLSIWIYGLSLLLATVFIQSMLISSDLEVFRRLTLLVFSYGSYYYIITSLATYFSSRLKNNTSALSSILATWILWTIFLPKIWGNAVEKIHTDPR